MTNLEELKILNIIPEAVIDDILGKGFELDTEDIGNNDFIDFERHTRIDDESNYTERLTVNPAVGFWYSSLTLNSDLTVMQQYYGASGEVADYQTALQWLTNKMQNIQNKVDTDFILC